MAIVEKLDEEELALVEMLRHPVWFGELMRELEPGREDDDIFEYSDYQVAILCDFNNFVNLTAGRSVGKTVVLEDKLQWLSVNYFYPETVVFTVPNRVHLQPVFLKLTKRYRYHPFLKQYAHINSINSSNFTISLKNGFFLDCRIAGQSNTEAPVAGLHVPFIFLDESAFYPFGTYMGLLPILNTFQKGHQLFVSGTPDGRREKSVNFYCDMIDTTFTKHRIPAHRNPRWTDEDEQNAINRYGGVDSEGYIHAVLGEHGAPVYSMFDRGSMKIEKYEIFTDKRKGREFSDNSQFAYTYVSTLPQLPSYYDAVLLGVDLGYTEPSVITILYRLQDKFYFHSRIQLQQVDYPIQEKLIDLIDSKYKPVVIGIDAGAGGSGKSVIQHLTTDDVYLNKNYKGKIVPIEFGGKTSIGFDDAGEELLINTKQFSMQKLQAVVNNKDLIFSDMDEEMISELERTRYSRTESGNIKYSVESFGGKEGRGEDHATASLICGLMGWYSKFESSNYLPEIKLLKSFRWFES